MKNDANRWIAGISLLALFAIIAYAGGRAAPKAQATQNVLVTNNSSQPIPVAARPATGAYIVAVANAPTVKVASSLAAPVVTKDSYNPDAHGGLNSGNFTMPALTTMQSSPQISLSPLATVIDSIGVSGGSSQAGEPIDFGLLYCYDSGGKSLGGFPFTIPIEPGNNRISAYSGSLHIPVPAGGTVQLYTQRSAATGSCYVQYCFAYHTVPNP